MPKATSHPKSTLVFELLAIGSLLLDTAIITLRHLDTDVWLFLKKNVIFGPKTWKLGSYSEIKGQILNKSPYMCICTFRAITNNNINVFQGNFKFPATLGQKICQFSLVPKTMIFLVFWPLFWTLSIRWIKACLCHIQWSCGTEQQFWWL